MTPTCDSTVASKSIPITNIKRTASEIQLQEEEAMADYRDYCMYARIVNGMSEKRERISDSFRRSTDQSLANIMRTRTLPVKEESFPQEETYNSDNLIDVAIANSRLQQRQYYLNGTGLGFEEEREEEIFILDL
jgi:hypothetical protein